MKNILGITGLLLMMGSAGAVEHGLISPTQGIIQTIICLIITLLSIKNIKGVDSK